MAHQLNDHTFRSSLNPKPAARSGPTHRSGMRSKSPSGTRLSVQNSHQDSSGPEIYVQQGDNSPAEQHELDDIPFRPETLPGFQQTPSLGSSPQLSACNVDRDAGDHAVPKSSSRRPAWRSALPPRTETSDSDDRQSVWSESNTNVPRRNLNTFDVAALIFNKMVGVFSGYL